ncbi:sensor histidine kinase [Fictibacillus barbaricus]|uniref:histidine kinase n=1 Tax=Fictibacillus barbaricus TaxID=182136 RepID=A0ABS2ZBW7_9BACL|nr:sensor histidine kinase [Fictibacillus barbaricus]MBN3544159.1 sensor histidine kinase [Fictibacillus barbaricus]GGB69402.1 two-component sensor histidine kinase [Fictibacillus barbaricus]
MNIALLLIVGILLIIIYLQNKRNQTRSRHLQQLHEKLGKIVTENTMEKLLLMTGDKELITILNEINRLLNRNQKMMADYNKMEDSIKKMLSNISHDLKTPLTVILGYIEIINLEPDMKREERMLLLSKVNNKTNEVLELINKFFDLAKLESGDKDIPLSRVQINEVCRKNMLEFYDILNGKGFEVNIDIPEEPIYAWANEEALDRILTNLLSNAIQHGGDGKVLGLSVKSDHKKIYIDVYDRGKGISELHKNRVFERIYTLEDSRNKSYQGSGLGLTITKRLVEKLGGTISIDSKPHVKTVFSLTLKKVIYKKDHGIS